MKILFLQEIKYKAEVIAAQRAGFDCLFFSLDAFLKASGNSDVLKGWLPTFEQPQLTLLRGVVMSPPLYESLYKYLSKSHNLWLINTPDEYLETCSVVNHYDKIKEYAPITAWIDSFDQSRTIIQVFADTFAPGTKLMIKDFMRSAKYERKQAYDIADSSDVTEVQAAIEHLIAAKNGVLEGGVVFSEYTEFNLLHPTPLPFTRQNIYEEYRLWFWKGKLLLKTAYFEEMPDYASKLSREELVLFKRIVETICSNFFVMDIARLKADGSLCIVELNPGQTSGINYHNHHRFYQALYDKQCPTSYDDNNDTI
ncbi:MAG TPA: hypothetical protein DCS93_35715 [Microscillaceae bacterium]|nr:hypothetical protein [Microscillaceae bacterium]